jgi:hypothetical protein
MLEENARALREWAVVEEALASGEVSLLLRKGGIRDRRDGHTAEHTEFWVDPADWNQDPAELTDRVQALLHRLPARPAQGSRIRTYAVVERVYRIEDADALDRLQGLHALSPAAAHQRFRYHERPLVHALLVRAYVLGGPVLVPASPSDDDVWVELPRALPTAGLAPVLSGEAFALVAAEVERRLGGAEA